jgi:hypothetical protein
MKKILLFVSSFYCLSSFSQIPTAGMVAGYSFSGNAIDESVNGNNGTVNGTTPAAGKAGVPNTAYYFNGSNNSIIVPNSPTLCSLSVLTMCAVVKPQGFYSGTCQGNMIFQKGYGSVQGEYGLMFSDQAYDPNCFTFDPTYENFRAVIGTNAFNVMYNPYITLNSWYCVVSTFDGDSIILYEDGVKKYSIAAPNPLGVNSSNLTIGYMDPSFPYWFNGIMDDIRIYNRILSLSEINEYCSFFVGIEENSLTQENSIYPNPFNDKLKITTTRERIISLITPTGQQILHQTTTSAETILNTESLAAGLYFLRVEDGEGGRNYKVIKQ